LAALAASVLSLPVEAQPACPDPAARAVSVEGRVEFKTRSSDWSAVQLEQPLCAGDIVRVLERSRAGLALRNDILLRLDQNTVLTVGAAQVEQPTVLDLVRGWLHVITRHRKQFRVTTPFVNAVVEGTEFTVSAEDSQSAVLVTEGRVRMENARGGLALGAGESGLAKDGAEPLPYLQVRPRDAVQWALYFPPVLRYAPREVDAPDREAARLAAEGDLTGALASLAAVPASQRSAQSRAFEASLLLSVGRVDEARALLDELEVRTPPSPDVLALRAIIALTTGERTRASELAARAVQSSPPSAAAWVAQSYVQQA
jgi:hypothetical protein